MILKNKIILGVSATIVGATAIGLGLGLGLQTSSSVSRNDRATAINAAKEVLDIAIPSKTPDTTTTYQSGFGNSISFTNVSNSDTYFTVNLSRMLVKDADLYDLGLGFGVFAIERTNEVLPNASYAYDNYNRVVVLDSEFQNFKNKYPDVKEVTEGTATNLGYKEYVLPILDKNGNAVKKDSETAKVYFVDPQNGSLTPLETTAISSGGTVVYRPTSISKDLVPRIHQAIFYQIYKLAVLADEVNSRIAFVNVATETSQIINRQLFTFEDLSKAGTPHLTTVAGHAKEAIKSLLGDTNGALSFQRMTQDIELYTKEKYDTLSDSDLVNVYEFDSEGIATFTDNGKTSTYELSNADIGNYAAVRITNYVRSSQNIIQLSKSEIDGITKLFDEQAISKIKLSIGTHESDKITYTEGQVAVISKRSNHPWTKLQELGESAVRLQAQEENNLNKDKQYINVLYDNRVKSGFKFPGVMYGFVPNLIGSYPDARDRVVKPTRGMVLSQESYASFLLNAYKKDITLANNTIISRLKMNNLFKTITLTDSTIDATQLDKFSLSNPIVHAVADDDLDVSVYYKMFANYQDGAGEARQKAFSKADWKKALFGTTTVTDAELLRYIFLQAKITNSGYQKDYLESSTNTVKPRKEKRYTSAIDPVTKLPVVTDDNPLSFSVIRIALPAPTKDIQTLLAKNPNVKPGDVTYDNGFLHIVNNAIEVLKTLFSAKSFNLVDYFNSSSTTPTANPFVFEQVDINEAITAVETIDYPQFKNVVFPKVEPIFTNYVGTQIFATPSVSLNNKLIAAFEKFISNAPSYTTIKSVTDPADDKKRVDLATKVELKKPFVANTFKLLSGKTIAEAHPEFSGVTFNVYSLTLNTTPLVDRVAEGTQFVVGKAPKQGTPATLGSSSNWLNGLMTEQMPKSGLVEQNLKNFLDLVLDKNSRTPSANFLVLRNWVDGAKKVKTYSGAEIDPDQFEGIRNVIRMFAILDELKMQIRITMRSGSESVTHEMIDAYLGVGNYEIVNEDKSKTPIRPIISPTLGHYVDALVSAYKADDPFYIADKKLQLDEEAAKIKAEVTSFMTTLS